MKKWLFSVAMFMALLTLTTPSKAAIAGDKDCSDFLSKNSVMDFWYNNGYCKTNDPHDLDRNNDGLPCEVSSSEYSSYVKSKTTTTTSGWKLVNGKWYYYTSGIKKTRWLSTGGQWYFFDTTGVMKTGWVSTGGKWYFFNSNGTMKTGWIQSSSKWYYLNANGVMATGWNKVSGAWYFFDTTGAMKTGWISSGGKWYFLNSNGKMHTGFAKISNQTYYFDASGIMKTGWVDFEDTRYFFNTNGAMKIGWFVDSGAWYYVDLEYGMLTGWNTIDGKQYYFYEDGEMAFNTEIDGLNLGFDGSVYTPVLTSFFDEERQQQIGELVEYYFDTDSVDFEVKYASEFAKFTIDGFQFAEATNGMVYGNLEDYEFLTDLAVIVNAPYGTDIIELVNEAFDNGISNNGQLKIVVNEEDETLGFYWDMFYNYQK